MLLAGPVGAQAHVRAHASVSGHAQARSTPVETPAPAAEAPHLHGIHAFDAMFRKYTARYFGPDADWHWFRAQAMVESKLNPSRRGMGGAQGMMQIMPDTFRRLHRHDPTFQNPYDADDNIAAGIYYNRMIYQAWRHVKNPVDRIKLMLASYNAGLNHVQRAARKAGNAQSYAAIEPMLYPSTREYVEKVVHEKGKIG